MPARKGPKKINQYSLELKRTAVRLSEAPGARVKDVAEAYQRADLVVVGTGIENPKNGKPQDLEVSVVVKGPNKVDQRLKLVGPRCQGTACDGLSVPPNRKFLLLLRQVPGGAFHKVDGNGNDACPNVFEVDGDYAKIGLGGSN